MVHGEPSIGPHSDSELDVTVGTLLLGTLLWKTDRLRGALSYQHKGHDSGQPGRRRATLSRHRRGGCDGLAPCRAFVERGSRPTLRRLAQPGARRVYLSTAHPFVCDLTSLPERIHDRLRRRRCAHCRELVNASLGGGNGIVGLGHVRATVGLQPS